MGEEYFRLLIDRVKGLELNDIEVTSDVCPDRPGETWLNAWCEFESDAGGYCRYNIIVIIAGLDDRSSTW